MSQFLVFKTTCKKVHGTPMKERLVIFKFFGRFLHKMAILQHLPEN